MRFALSLLALAPLAALAPFACKSSFPAPLDAGGTASSPSFPDVPTTGNVQLDHLSGPVDMVRDAHGMIHVYASTIADAMRVEGYQTARDRTVQLEMIRREAEGRLAELLGDTAPQLIDSDIAMRTIGLNREGAAMYAALDPNGEEKAWIDAYADGITQFNARVQSGEESIPPSMLGFPQAGLGPWTGADVLAVARLQAWNLAYDGPSDIDDTSFVEAARAEFSATSSDPLVAKRAGFLRDVLRFAPIDPTTVLGGYPGATTSAPMPSATPRRAPTRAIDRAALDATKGFRDAAEQVHRVFARDHFGSNDWIVGPALSASGHAMLANDPHLALSAPSTFYMAHVHVESASDPTQNLDFAGMSFPGLLGIILGFNQHVAWGATDAFFDVTDVYQESLTSDGSAVVFNGSNVPLQKVHEEIKVANGAPVEYDVLVVPHHGPIVPTIANHAIVPLDPSKGAMSVKWTGDQVTQDAKAIVGYIRAKTVDDAKAAAQSFAVGAENWVFADTHGDILYSAHAILPTRDPRAFAWNAATFSGNLPRFVLPGDGSCEWIGTLPDEFIPQAKNPAAGFLVTANNDQVGATLDDDPSNDKLPNGQPHYLSGYYDPGLRAGRITRDIQTAGKKLTIDDLAAIQADARSNVAPMIAPKIVDAIGRAEEEKKTPGTHPDLTAIVGDPRYAAANAASIATLLASWGTDADYDTSSGLNPDDGSLAADSLEASASKATLLFNAWIVTMERATFADELAKMQVSGPTGRIDLRQALGYLMTAPDPTKLATYDAATKDSALYDDMTTPAIETRDERVIRALLDAVDLVKKQLGADDAQWRWGQMHTITFGSLVPFWGWLSIPPTTDPTFPNGFPRHGEAETVDVGDYGDWLDPKSLTSFGYTNGPVQRFVIEMAPDGPIPRNVLPGGEVWNDKSGHFRDEAELWRRNRNHAVPTTHDAILSEGSDAGPTAVVGPDEHVVYAP